VEREDSKKSALFISALAAQHRLDFNNNGHQVLAESRIKEMKESRTRTNHDPRMNRISLIVLVELPPNTTRIRRSLVHEVPLVLDLIDCSLPCVFV
jgi:hypothetical protein